MAPLLWKGIVYSGFYEFQQVKRPTLRRGNRTASSVVTFSGATPLLQEFLKPLLKGKLPRIESYGIPLDKGNYEGYAVNDHPIWPEVEFYFSLDSSDVELRSNRISRGLRIQTCRVQGPGNSYYEAVYYSPTATRVQQVRSEPGGAPSSAPSPSGDIVIIRERLVTDPDAPPADLTPIQETRVEDYDTQELIDGKLWEVRVTTAKVLLDDDRS